MQLTGGCLCGAVRYVIEAEFSNRCFCHCHSCRRASGAPFVAWGTCPKACFTLTAGPLTTYASSQGVRRGHCGACGTCLTYANAGSQATLDVALATLDQANQVKPEFHIWTADKLEWVSINDGLPAYPGWRTP